MRVLWASAHIADPSRGGGWAMEYELLRHAATRHEVLVVSGELAPEEPAPAVVTDLGVRVRGVARPVRPIERNRLQMLRRLATSDTPTGAWMVAPSVAAMADAVRAAEDEGGVDLVHVMPQEAASAVAASRAPTALLLGDSYWAHVDRELRAATSFKDKLRLTLDRRSCARWERGWYPQADAVACMSEADAAVLTDLCGIPVDVVRNPIGDEWFATPTVLRSHDLVTMVGALDYEPNVDGVVWFASEIWPRVRTLAPHARLRVVGRRPTAAVRAAVAGAGGELLADVPDVRPHYWEAAVVPAPTRLGAGVKSKVLHAAACDAPQVGTTFAFADTGARDGVDVLMADDAGAMADAVAHVLRKPADAATRALAARHIAATHRIDRVGDAFDEFWARALRPSAGTPPASRARRETT